MASDNEKDKPKVGGYTQDARDKREQKLKDQGLMKYMSNKTQQGIDKEKAEQVASADRARRKAQGIA